MQRALVAWAVRRTFAAFSRRDWEFNTLLLDPDRYEFLVGDRFAQAPGMKDRYFGAPGYLEAMMAVLDIFPRTVVEVEHHGWVPDGRLAIGLRFHAAGASSGVEGDQRALIAVELREGLVVRHWYWWDVEAGSRSLGIEPPRR
ncbi:MAG TPA: hypothetical protein VHF58_02305 [Solirubrobacterales bacterium]|nr:hypothetical protein [Solirubrobacterales bacterium]